MPRIAVFMLVTFIAIAPARANEIWIAATYQQDIGLGVGSGFVWPTSAVGAVRLAWAIPGDLQTFQGAKLVLIPEAAAASATLTVYVCRAAGGQAATGACTGPHTVPFSSTANQLLEIDVSTAIGPQVGTPGANHLTVLAFTTPTIATDRILGLRFAYAPVLPAAAATLGANTFTGTQTAPAFAGSGTALTGVAKLTANSFSGTQTINNGNLDLDPSAPGTGRITRNGAVLLHTFGGTFLGIGAGNDSMSGGNNVGMGDGALAGITTGERNVGLGFHASLNNTLGTSNVAVGFAALENNQTGSSNVAIGSTALNDTTSSCCNTAVGQNALSRSTGLGNTALGQGAGILLVSGNNNLYLSNRGVDTDSNTTRIGQPGTHTRLFASGVRNVTTGQANAIPVVIDSDGQLGTVSSSRRYKEDIHDMADVSNRLLQLRPVTFRYTQAFADGAKPTQFGLIAEEVAEAFPELVVRDEHGRPETVQYHNLSVLLLNELQKQQARLAALERELAALRQERRR